MATGKELSGDISSLAKEFKVGNRTPETHLFCNETGFASAIPLIEQKRAQKPGGIGLVVGSAGIHSLLPSLELDGVLVVDINPVVLDFTQAVGAAIDENDTPEDAQERLFREGTPDAFPVISEVQAAGLRVGHLKEFQLRDETEQFDTYHWTNPDRFPLVKGARAATPISYVSADVTDPVFAQKLAAVLERHGQALTYVGLSNVHEWVDSMDFLQNWPISGASTMQYATHEGVELFWPSYPRVEIAESLVTYLNTVRTDEMSGKFKPR